MIIRVISPMNIMLFGLIGKKKVEAPKLGHAIIEGGENGDVLYLHYTLARITIPENIRRVSYDDINLGLVGRMSQSGVYVGEDDSLFYPDDETMVVDSIPMINFVSRPVSLFNQDGRVFADTDLYKGNRMFLDTRFPAFIRDVQKSIRENGGLVETFDKYKKIVSR